MATRRPRFQDLTPEQQLAFGNGVGPNWMPEWLRGFITHTASWFFEDASWRHHDFGYAVGGDRWDRARCDWKFFRAMLIDAWTQRGFFWFPAMLVAVALSLAFYISVRIGGQWGAFCYRSSYATLEEILALDAR